MTTPTVALVFHSCNRQGGVERAVREVGRRLATTYPVTFVGDNFDPEGMDGVTFRPLGGRRMTGVLAPLSFRIRAGRALRRHRYDLVISWGAQCPPGDLQAVNSVHRAWLQHGRPAPTRLGAVPNWVRYFMPQHAIRLLLERAYFRTRREPTVCAVSEQTADEIGTIYGVPRTRMLIIPNGYSGEEFSAQRSAAERAQRRAGLGLDDGHVLILLVANELHRKGFATLLDAVAIVGDPSIRVAVVGRGPVSAYREQIERLGLADHVRWHGPSADVGSWYAAADLFVMPSQYEAYPLVVIEALASGLPVITTALAGSLDAVQPGVNGLLLSDPNDSDELAGLLRHGLDARTRAAWAAAAADSVRRLEWSAIVDRYLDVLAKLTR